MSTATATRKKRDLFDWWWQGRSMPLALRALWVAARADGLAPEDVARVLDGYHPGAVACALRRAEARGHLVRVRRLSIDEAGDVASEWRYQPMGTRP